MRGVLWAVVCWSVFTGCARGAELWLLVEPDLTAYLFNPGSEPLAFDGYHLQSSKSLLDPSGWRSISDYSLDFESDTVEGSLGLGALTFGETKPSNYSLAELNLGSYGVLQPGEQFALGRPLVGSFAGIAARVGTTPGVPDDPVYQFSFHQPGIVTGQAGDIVAVPEPSALGLACIAAAAALGAHCRSAKR